MADRLRGDDGRVDAFLLAKALTGGGATRRPAQEAMASEVAAHVSDRRDVMIEAPTGSGKSLVLLAQALDWVAAGPDRRAVISTFTKLLQTQLAADLDALARTVPTLSVGVDLVKGSANRLSLRSLTVALAALATGTPHRVGLSRRLAAEPTFAELAVYLLLRLLATAPGGEQPGSPSAGLLDRWTARSVDPADLPQVFDTWVAGRLSWFCHELSQGRAGDYWPNEDALADHTQSVREALQGRRLVIVNHALLCSTSSVLTDMADTSRLLLLADEAHELEAAATSTLSASFDYRSLEALTAELVDLTTTLPDTSQNPGADQQESGTLERGAARRDLISAVADLDELLATEQLPNAVASAFGTTSVSDLLTATDARSVAVADIDADAGQLRRAATVERLLRVLSGRMVGVLAALRQTATTLAGTELADSIITLHRRFEDTLETAWAVRCDLAQLLEIEETAEGAPDVVQTTLSVDETADDLTPAGQGDNRLVWAQQPQMIGSTLDRFVSHGLSMRWWPFTLTTTPIDVSADPRFAAFRAAFEASVFTSGTLTLPAMDDEFGYFRNRLGLHDAAGVVIVSDFDPATQAELVAFSDFPSWAEEKPAAIATIGWQLSRYARTAVDGSGRFGAMVLTTSRADAGGVAEALTVQRHPEDTWLLHDAVLNGNPQALANFVGSGGILTGTRGLWQGVNVADPDRLRLVWINKLPFPPVGDPILEARRHRVEAQAADAGQDPEQAGMEGYYLPQAALALKQAVGRLLRSTDHRGVVVISDSRLAGDVRLRRTYRRMFLASLDAGFARDDGSGDFGAANVSTMEEAWRRIWAFLARDDVAAITPAQAEALSTDQALTEHAWLPHTRTIREAQLKDQDWAQADSDHRRTRLLLERAAIVGGGLTLSDGPIQLKAEQVEAIEHIAAGRDVLAILPTGFGKSFLYQLPGLVLPGTALVVSPLVSLMTDQALRLNRTVGGQVRALVGTMRESNSRMGKAQVLEQLEGKRDWNIKLVYLSPERLATAQFQHIVRTAVERGTLSLVAFDEAHTLAQWGDSFRPKIRRAEHFIRTLRDTYGAPQIVAATATATGAVRRHLLADLIGTDPDHPDTTKVGLVSADPIRRDLATYKVAVNAGRNQHNNVQASLTRRVLETVDGHAIVYATTVKEVERLHGYLTDAFGRRRQVLKYHGQLGELEKTSTANYFTAAPQRDDAEGFRPMVVVATKAFGLGIDRDDIRLVLCASPPGDLSELYQAMGRAGRDMVGTPPAEIGTPAVGAAAMTGRSWHLLRWMNRHDPDQSRIIDDIVDAILTGASPLQPGLLVEQLVADGIDAGRLGESADDDEYLKQAYASLVVRTFAALADDGVIADLGDCPLQATIDVGDDLAAADTSPAAGLAHTILEARPVGQTVVELERLFGSLPAAARDELGDVGGMWHEILELYATGHLEVSQASNPGFASTMNYRVISTAVSMDLHSRLLQLHRERQQDLQLLKEWFEDEDSCALEGLADYFHSTASFDHAACRHDATRCSSCWTEPTHLSTPRPATLEALFTDLSELRADAADVEQVLARRIRRACEGVLRVYANGVGSRKLHAAVIGQDVLFYGGNVSRLPSRIVNSQFFGRVPDASVGQVGRAVDALAEQGKVVQVNENGYSWWRHAVHVQPGGP